MDIYALMAERKSVADDLCSTLTCLGVLRASLIGSPTEEARQHLLSTIEGEMSAARELGDRLLKLDRFNYCGGARRLWVQAHCFPPRSISETALQCCQAVVSLERQREGPVEATQDTALLLQRAVAAHLVLARKHIDRLDPQGLRAACPAIDPGTVRQSDLIADRRIAVGGADRAVAVQAHGGDGTENGTVAVDLPGRGRQDNC